MYQPPPPEPSNWWERLLRFFDNDRLLALMFIVCILITVAAFSIALYETVSFDSRGMISSPLP